MNRKAKEDQSEEMAPVQTPRSLPILESGVQNTAQFNAAMSAIMADVVAGRLTHGQTNAAVRAGAALLKSVELEQRYGKPNNDGVKVLELDRSQKSKNVQAELLEMRKAMDAKLKELEQNEAA